MKNPRPAPSHRVRTAEETLSSPETTREHRQPVNRHDFSQRRQGLPHCQEQPERPQTVMWTSPLNRILREARTGCRDGMPSRISPDNFPPEIPTPPLSPYPSSSGGTARAGICGKIFRQGRKHVAHGDCFRRTQPRSPRCSVGSFNDTGQRLHRQNHRRLDRLVVIPQSLFRDHYSRWSCRRIGPIVGWSRDASSRESTADR